MATTDSAIEVGTIVLYYNHWTGYANPDIKKHFRLATRTEIANLKSGDIFWFPDQPHVNGKVHGYRKTKVAKIYGERVHHSAGAINTRKFERFLIVDDESPVLAAIAADPLVTDVLGEAGRLLGSFLHPAIPPKE